MPLQSESPNRCLGHTSLTTRGPEYAKQRSIHIHTGATKQTLHWHANPRHPDAPNQPTLNDRKPSITCKCLFSASSPEFQKVSPALVTRGFSDRRLTLGRRKRGKCGISCPKFIGRVALKLKITTATRFSRAAERKHVHGWYASRTVWVSSGIVLTLLLGFGEAESSCCSSILMYKLLSTNT